MTEQITQPFQMFLRHPRGTTVRATNLAEAQRLQEQAGYQQISAKEGEAAFAQKKVVAQKLGIRPE